MTRSKKKATAKRPAAATYRSQTAGPGVDAAFKEKFDTLFNAEPGRAQFATTPAPIRSDTPVPTATDRENVRIALDQMQQLSNLRERIRTQHAELQKIDPRNPAYFDTLDNMTNGFVSFVALAHDIQQVTEV